MAKYIREKDAELRKLVVSLEGDQEAIGLILGITPSAVSHRLGSDLNRAWWASFKKRRSKRRKAARQHRWRRNASARHR